MTTSTSTPTHRVRRGSALAIATLIAAGTGTTALLTAPTASARSQFAGCTFQVAKTDQAGTRWLAPASS